MVGGEAPSRKEDRLLAAFRPIRIRSASDEVLAVLADAIRGGLYVPGDLLPRERDLAARLAVSRTVVREAIAVLRQEGVVTVRRGQGGGTIVGSPRNLPRVLVRIAGETRLEIRSMLEVRRAMEVPAALLASERCDSDGIRRLEDLVQELPALSGLHHEFYEADVRFHLAVAELSGNPMIAEIVLTVFNRIAVLREPFPHAHVDFEDAIANQRDLLKAIVSQRPRLIVTTVDRHLAAFEQVMLGEALPSAFGPQQGQPGKVIDVEDGVRSRAAVRRNRRGPRPR